MSILCIPATSAASERNFSTAGWIYNVRRSQLDPDTLDDLLFLWSYLRAQGRGVSLHLDHPGTIPIFSSLDREYDLVFSCYCIFPMFFFC